MTRRSLLARAAMTLAGVTLLPSVAAARSVEPRAAASTPAWYYPLSPRHAELAVLVARGLSDVEASRAMGVSRTTFRCHVQLVLRQLGLKGQSDLRAWVARHRKRSFLGLPT